MPQPFNPPNVVYRPALEAEDGRSFVLELDGRTLPLNRAELTELVRRAQVALVETIDAGEPDHRVAHPDWFDGFAVNRWELARVWAVAKRLYSENRMTGDEMRDAAQLLDYVVAHAIPMDEALPFEKDRDFAKVDATVAQQMTLQKGGA